MRDTADTMAVSTGAPSSTPSTDAPVKVNTASLSELKLALDDKVKAVSSAPGRAPELTAGSTPVLTSSLVHPQVLSTPTSSAAYGAPFVRVHFREDVRLAVGWASVLVAGLTAWHGYTAPFAESKTLVGSGVALSVQVIYVHCEERGVAGGGQGSWSELTRVACFGLRRYALLSVFCAWWAHAVEKDIVFEGKRRSLIQGKVSPTPPSILLWRRAS